MPFFRDISIKTKLSVLVAVAGGAATLLCSAAFVFNDVYMIRLSKVRQLSALANVLGSNSAAALTFDDPGTARELLSSLSLQPTVQFACLYNAKGRVFATYANEEGRGFVPPAAEPTGHEFTPGGYLDISQELVHDGEKVGTIYLHATMRDLYDEILHYVNIVLLVMLASFVASLVLSRGLQRIISVPILHLARTAQRISKERDYSIRVEKHASDELGALYDEFNGMLDQIQRGETELQRAHDLLEARVEERTRQLSRANVELNKEIAERKRTEEELETVHEQLVDAARKAGMAEIATGVLHNVGNVLNSINVSATLVSDRMRNSKLSELARAIELMNRNAENLGTFITEHERGKKLPGFLTLVSEHLGNERRMIVEELRSLTKNVDHIKAIVAMQQSYAGVAGLVETVSLTDLVDDALKLNAPSFEKHGIELVRDYADLPEVRVDKQKLLQILVNLVANAKDSLIERAAAERQMTVSVSMTGEERVRIDIADNGVGIPSENLTRIFSHGFTTKKHGHGFGLHSSANAAKELGGELTVSSEGLGQGATFRIEIPFEPVEVLV
ncbi:MAG: ATP-binding protein [Pirellulales bacterium]